LAAVISGADFDRVTAMYPQMDFRVDRTKLIYCDTKRTLPIRCTGTYVGIYLKRYSMWRRVWMWVSNTTPSWDKYRDNERCMMPLGHWDDPEAWSTIYHVNGFGDQWRVTAEETRPYNPDSEKAP